MHSPWSLLILLIPIIAEYYVSHRVWQLLPPILPLKVTVVALMTLAFILAFVSFSGALDRMPLELGTFTYEVGNSWLILLLYLVMLFGTRPSLLPQRERRGERECAPLLHRTLHLCPPTL